MLPSLPPWGNSVTEGAARLEVDPAFAFVTYSCCQSCGKLGIMGCSKIAEAEAGVSVNEKKWLVMHIMGCHMGRNGRHMSH